MAFRVFQDAGGTEWQVYDVVPVREERRVTPRRSLEAVVPGELGERRTTDRRISVGSIPSSRLPSGWLCFEHDGERRRLSPIPEDWPHADNARLTEWLGAARPAQKFGPAES